MRFNVEKTFLKTESELPTLSSVQATLLQTEADDITEALRSAIEHDQAELVDEVHWLPGSQAVTAVRQGSDVFLLQISPADGDGDFDEPRMRAGDDALVRM